MTQAEIQSTFTESPCVGSLTPDQLDALKVILLWKALAGDVPMTQEDIQNLFDESPCVTNLTPDQLAQLQVILLWEQLP